MLNEISDYLRMIDDADNAHSPTSRAAYADALIDVLRDIFTDEEIQALAQAKAEGRLVVLPETGIGDLSDGYHTFNELYHHRAILFSVICNEHPDISWKSKLHHDGTMFDGMFIVGINTPEGQATYHYDINPYWDMFRVRELEKAPEWDGHTSEQAIERIAGLTTDKDELVKVLKQARDAINGYSTCPYCWGVNGHAKGCKFYEALQNIDALIGGEEDV